MIAWLPENEKSNATIKKEKVKRQITVYKKDATKGTAQRTIALYPFANYSAPQHTVMSVFLRVCYVVVSLGYTLQTC
jgi:hypothetical protein